MLDILDSVCTVGVILTVISTVVLNLTVIAAYFKMIKDTRQNVTNTFLVNQAFADITVAICSIISLSGTLSYRTFFLYTSHVALISLMATTLDSSFSIKLPLQHQRFVGKYKVVMVVLSIWAVSAIPAIVYGCLYADSFQNFTFAKVVFILLLAFVVIVVTLLCYNYKILRSSIDQRIENMASLPLNERRDDELKEERHKKRRLLLCLFSMATGYTITILPHIILVLVALHSKGANRAAGDWQSLTYLIYTLSATVNPLFTIFLRHDFRQAKNWLKLKGCYSRPKREENVEQDVTMMEATEM